MDTDYSPPGPDSRLPIYDRLLRSYPAGAERTYYLALTVLATVALYYQAYCGGTVAPQILNYYGITIKFYLFAAVVGFVLGAVATVLGGLADRIGRANLVAYGLLVVGVLVAFVQPHMPDKWAFAGVGSLVGFVEGVILVATPALMRDFSPRMGRATAMGFWSLGPVIGSLCAAEVSSHTLGHLKAWQDQFTVAGLAGLVVGVLVVYTLRELAPELRDQVMVRAGDSTLIEVRAGQAPLTADVEDPWRQMVTARIVSSAFAISAFLMLYYVLVGAFVIYLETTYRFSGSRANSIADWVWLVNAVALVFFGVVSDRLRVRKPFMLVGGVGSLVATSIFVAHVPDRNLSSQTLTVLLSVQAVFGSMVFGPWMAGFTEMVEDRNPALVATGIAVWGGVLRVVVAIVVFLFPFVVPAVTPLVDYGPQVQQYALDYSAAGPTIKAITPSVLATLQRDPTNQAAVGSALAEIEAARRVTPAEALTDLVALGRLAPELKYLSKHAPAVITAEKKDPSEWQHWFAVTAVGQLIFIPFVFGMIGPWTRAAGRRRDDEEEQRLHHLVDAGG